MVKSHASACFCDKIFDFMGYALKGYQNLDLPDGHLWGGELWNVNIHNLYIGVAKTKIPK